MTGGGLSTDYDDRANMAVTAVMLELGQVLGSWRKQFVVIGGSVPWLHFRDGSPPHIGTLDVDLCLDAEALGNGQYATLVKRLEDSGYERGHDELRAFQLRKSVTVDEGAPIVVLVDLLMPKNARIKKNRPRLVQGLRVIEADGGDLALRELVEVTLAGAMPDGRHNEVVLQVASIPALLVMKGYALNGRDKKKDAYDIYYVVRQFAGGPAALAEACRPLLANPDAMKGFRFIADKFKSPTGFGPSTVRLFLGQSTAGGGLSPEQLQTDAFQQVDVWLRALGLR